MVGWLDKFLGICITRAHDEVEHLEEGGHWKAVRADNIRSLSTQQQNNPPVSTGKGIEGEPTCT